MSMLVRPLTRHLALIAGALLLGVMLFAGQPMAADKEKPVKRDHSRVISPPAPRGPRHNASKLARSST